MSSALAIAAVTAALKDLLNDGLIDHDLSRVGSFSVTATPPDRVTTGQNEPNQLNLFLYQVTANVGWRNAALPSRGADGTRLSNPPLALDLHYMLTAYGAQDFNAEILLGYAMQLLHENPVLTRAQLRTVLAPVLPVTGALLPGPFGTLSAVDLADQIELIKISPVFLSTEDLSKMWTAMQARYRPTMAYLASVVLIEAGAPTRTAAPVLKRGKDDRGNAALAMPPPMLSGVRPAASEFLPAMRLGDDLLVSGANLNLSGTVTAVFENASAQAPIKLPALAIGDATSLTVHVPSIAEDGEGMHNWASGLYAVSVRVGQTDLPAWSTNSVALAVAPRITLSALSGAAGDTITLEVTPRLLLQQETRAVILFGSRSILPASVTTPANPLLPTTVAFAIPAVPKGLHLVRLRIDGVDSIPVVFSGPPAAMDFDPNQQVTVV